MPAEAATKAEAAAIEAGAAPAVEIEAVLLHVLGHLDAVGGDLRATERIERARLGATGRKHERGGRRESELDRTHVFFSWFFVRRRKAA